MTTGRIRHASIATCIAASLLFSGAASAAVLVDTGAGGTSSVGAQSLFNSGSSYQFLAGKFTLPTGAVLDTVEGWMAPFGTGGNVQVKIYGAGATPGAAIFSKTYTLGNRFVAGWDAFTNYYVSLPAGSYWVAFEPVSGSGFQYAMPPGAPAPLPSYAFNADGNNRWIAYATSPTIGFRLSGTASDAVPLGSAVRVMRVATLSDPLDASYGAMGLPESIGWIIGTTGLSWTRGTVTETGLDAGARADHNNDASFASRGVAFRSYFNSNNAAMTLKLNAVLHGSFFPWRVGDATGDLAVTAGVYAIDSPSFTSAVAASGLPIDKFLLGGDSLTASDGGRLRPSLAVLFPPAARLATQTTATDVQTAGTNVPLSLSLTTGLFTVAPHQIFTVMFDVSAVASNAFCLPSSPCDGTTDFLDSLVPGPSLFTDSGGAPVAGIQSLGAFVAVGEADVLSWTDKNTLTWGAAVGASSYRLYRGVASTLPNLLNASADGCVRFQGSETSTGPILTEVPSADGERFYWYLVAAANGASEGTSGTATAGARVVNATGTCP